MGLKLRPQGSAASAFLQQGSPAHQNFRSCAGPSCLSLHSVSMFGLNSYLLEIYSTHQHAVDSGKPFRKETCLARFNQALPKHVSLAAQAAKRAIISRHTWQSTLVKTLLEPTDKPLRQEIQGVCMCQRPWGSPSKGRAEDRMVSREGSGVANSRCTASSASGLPPPRLLLHYRHSLSRGQQRAKCSGARPSSVTHEYGTRSGPLGHQALEL